MRACVRLFYFPPTSCLLSARLSVCLFPHALCLLCSFCLSCFCITRKGRLCFVSFVCLLSLKRRTTIAPCCVSSLLGAYRGSFLSDSVYIPCFYLVPAYVELSTGRGLTPFVCLLSCTYGA